MNSSVLIFLIYISMMYVFGEKKRVLLCNILLGCVGGILGALLVSHIKVRIDVCLDPWADITGRGYQITQSLFAIGSGGFFGKGLGNSAQKMVIPEAQNDMILSIIFEELGDSVINKLLVSVIG